MKRIILIILVIVVVFDSIEVDARRGCCSHHGGVAGCSSNGRQLCRDGTLSPTCTCYVPTKDIYGCIDPSAKNYNSQATISDNSCVYKETIGSSYNNSDDTVFSFSEINEEEDDTEESTNILNILFYGGLALAVLSTESKKKY